jgi:hypothetical protein
MKKVTITLCVAAILGSGLLYLRKASQAKLEQARAAEAEQRLKEIEASAARQEEQNRILQGKLQEIDSDAKAKASEVHELKQQLASSAANSTKPPEPPPGAKLFKDPQMKTMMKKQQMENVSQMINKIVDGDFIKQLGLSGEQAGDLKGLLKKKYGPGADVLIELMAGELNDAQMADLGRNFKQQMSEADAQIKTYLGDDAYKTFEWQEKSQEDRSHLKDLQKKLDGLGQSLTPEQESGLLQAMYEERQNHKFQVDYSDPRNYDYEHLHEFFGDDNFNLYFQDLEQVNEKVLQRAQAILTPEQTGELKAMRQDQLEKAKVVVRMTNALLGQRRGR